MGTPERGREGGVKSFFRDLQEFSGKSFCPFLKTCSVKLTKDYFVRVCNTNGYMNCHHFAKRIGDLKTPVVWLQRIAVERADMAEERSRP